MKAEAYLVEEKELEGVPVVLRSYRIGDIYYAHVENKDPGATIARGEGSSREAARELALTKARARLKG